jgi:putative copper export protein
MLANLLFFLHLTGLAVWIGSLVIIALLLFSLRSKAGAPGEHHLLLTIIRLVKWLVNVAALAVLVSGAGLIQSLGYKPMTEPLYVKLMEQGGGLILVSFLVLMTIWSNRIQKRLQSKTQAPAEATRHLLTRYSMGLSVFAVLSVCVLLVVSLKLV